MSVGAFTLSPHQGWVATVDSGMFWETCAVPVVRACLDGTLGRFLNFVFDGEPEASWRGMGDHVLHRCRTAQSGPM